MASRARSIQQSGRTRTPVYTPPRPEDVSDLMADLMDWIQRSDKEGISPLIISAVAHYQFESIHPFVDGNGRTGRALSTLILYKMGYDTKH